jgi:hypothetical protein
VIARDIEKGMALKPRLNLAHTLTKPLELVCHLKVSVSRENVMAVRKQIPRVDNGIISTIQSRKLAVGI